jgi:hypothetical protein
MSAGERLIPQDSPLPTFLPRFPPRARPPPRGLRSRAVPTVYLTVCPSLCQVLLEKLVLGLVPVPGSIPGAGILPPI